MMIYFLIKLTIYLFFVLVVVISIIISIIMIVKYFENKTKVRMIQVFIARFFLILYYKKITVVFVPTHYVKLKFYRVTQIKL